MVSFLSLIFLFLFRSEIIRKSLVDLTNFAFSLDPSFLVIPKNRPFMVVIALFIVTSFIEDKIAHKCSMVKRKFTINISVEAYNYNFEIRRCILHFMSALDGAVIKRHDKNHNVLDIIKVNYVYGSKERIMRDLIDSVEHTKLPVVSVLLKSISRDASRVRENIIGSYNDSLYYNKSSMVEILPPVPVNLSFDVSIITKYQSDMEQILSNFVVYSDPYFIVSWKEPVTNRELRSEILWNGSISLDTPTELQAKGDYSKITASTSFEFKSFIFKSNPNPIGKICQIDTNYHLTDKRFCDFDHLDDYSETEESLTINGLPLVEWAEPIVIKTGTRSISCSGDWPDDEIHILPDIKNRTENIKLKGKFINVTDVFLSGDSDSLIVGQEMSAIDIFEDNDNFPPFNGILIDTIQPEQNLYELEIPIPVLSGDGFLNVIVVSPCGYSILSNDRKTRQPESDNPYPPEHEQHDAWKTFNDPFKNGIEVIDTSLECLSAEIFILASTDGEALKTIDDELMAEAL